MATLCPPTSAQIPVDIKESPLAASNSTNTGFMVGITVIAPPKQTLPENLDKLDVIYVGPHWNLDALLRRVHQSQGESEGGAGRVVTLYF